MSRIVTPQREGRSQIMVTARGLITENAPSGMFSAGTTLTSQAAQFLLVGLRAGDLVTNALVYVSTAGAGTAPTTIKLGLYTPAGTRLAISANEAADAKWTSNGFKSVAFTAPYTVTADGVFFGAILQDGVFGTTPIQFARLSTSPIGAIGANSPLVGQQTGQTDLPSSATITGATGPYFWFGVN